MDYRERWELKDYLAGQTLGRRIRLLQVGLVALVGAFLLNFWYLQVVKGKEYATLAETNRLRRIPMLPSRGVIFDRHEEVLAASRPSLDLVLLRESRHDSTEQIERLVDVLGAPYEVLAARLDELRQRPLYETLVLKEDVEFEQLARIESRREQFPSLQVRQTSRRSYPHGKMFGHVLGYVGEVDDASISAEKKVQPGDIVGKSGLERSYDDTLRGVRGWNLVQVNNVGRRVAGPWVATEPEHGTQLRLTIDARLQRALSEGLAGEVGAGVFLDVWTGEVLALASAPEFDPNDFADGLSAEAWKEISENALRPLHDRAIASHYAPGSVFKVLMAVAGLESGTISPHETVFCGGSTRIYDQQRLCWKKGGHGTVNLRSALAHSCNVYFYHLGKRLGIEQIDKHATLFGLGRPSGIDLPGEAAGIPPSASWKLRELREQWYPGDTISVAIGQGLLAVTPIQMARMLGGVATGRLARPHLVYDATAQVEDLPVRPETLRLVRAALADTVAEGTGRRASIEGIPIAGKTGTAQVFKHSAGIDSDKMAKAERDHAWFAGYAPADNPKIAFAVVVEHGGHGGTTAAPIVRKVLEVYFGKAEPPAAEDEVRAEASHDRTPPAG